jgi:adenine-specific DNA-methyltransferase
MQTATMPPANAPAGPQLTFPWPDGDAASVETVEIQSRRYLGSKSRLLPFLHRIVAQRCGAFESFGDFFAGTGVVAHSFNRPNVRVVANDYLESNAVCLSCWLGIRELCAREAAGLIAYLNSLPAADENYVSEQFGDRYFTRETARKIGVIRDEIDRLSLPNGLRALALTGLLYAMDRVARTVGHYDAYRQLPDSPSPRDERDRPFRLQLPRVDTDANAGNEIYRCDANRLAREVEVDVLYLDPPYNSRQYSDTYHVLETILKNDKPPLVGVARKRPGRPDRSRYCGKDAAAALDDLVTHARCRWLLISYNNMSGGDKRSNAILTEDQITAALSRRGPVEVFKTAFNSFTSKRELIEGHEERVYVCEVSSLKSQVSSRGLQSLEGADKTIPSRYSDQVTAPRLETLDLRPETGL